MTALTDDERERIAIEIEHIKDDAEAAREYTRRIKEAEEGKTNEQRPHRRQI